MRFEKFVTAIPSCKICHRKIEQNSINQMIFAGKSICLRCFLSLHPIYKRWRIGPIKAMAIYPYIDTFQSLLYLYKGCGDIELAPTFLQRLLPLLKLRYRGWTIVPVPSYVGRIVKRGYDHIPLIYQGLGKALVHAIEKTDDVKQSDLSKAQRKRIGEHLRLLPHVRLQGKKVLLVDDVYTTGATIHACLKLLATLHPRKMQVLVLARVKAHAHSP